jgi:hypothetical protein
MKFPYKAWRLLPSFKPVEVELVGFKDGFWCKGWPVDKKGSPHEPRSLFKTRDEVIQHGRDVVANRQAVLDKRQADLDKKRAALEKAYAPNL